MNGTGESECDVGLATTAGIEPSHVPRLLRWTPQCGLNHYLVVNFAVNFVLRQFGLKHCQRMPNFCPILFAGGAMTRVDVGIER